MQSMYFIFVLFFLVALLYSTVGFGGGSSYIGLLVLFEVPFNLAPVIALTCNLIVTLIGTWRFHKSNRLDFFSAFPLVLISIPAAYLTARIHIPQEVFKNILGVVLLFSGSILFFRREKLDISFDWRRPHPFIASCTGGLVGAVAGLVGIGGGVFLNPLMHFFKWGEIKKIAATSCLFILFNSCAAILGQLTKIQSYQEYYSYIPLFVGVAAGGCIGSFLINFKLDEKIVKKLTACLILFVSVRLLAL